ncbi:hypothetical protein AB0M29_33575 [Streptomyces sp. NPDC051976]|uniref:hypothetical protein n=1 Tax=Streptomyces sp. NPDC051976 TaxID=3154947 RepID=UPI00344A3781
MTTTRHALTGLAATAVLAVAGYLAPAAAAQSPTPVSPDNFHVDIAPAAPPAAPETSPDGAAALR